jgi:hypothetical protein
MPLRPCIDCGTISQGSRCAEHQRVKDRATLRGKRQRRPHASKAEERRRAAVVAAYRRTHGDWCPGWQRDPHPSSDLTADHVVGVGAGGAEGGELAVLCRVCNGAKADNVA